MQPIETDIWVPPLNVICYKQIRENVIKGPISLHKKKQTCMAKTSNRSQSLTFCRMLHVKCSGATIE